MAREQTPRMGLDFFTAGTDLHPTREEFNARMHSIDDQTAIFQEGAQDERPTPETRGRLFMATDTRVLFWDTGTEWIRVFRLGNAGPGRPLAVESGTTFNPQNPAYEGTSDWAARADHTHPLMLATRTTPGAMPAEDKEKLDGATDAGTAGRLMQRDGAGRARISTPTEATHVANKSYVDTQIGTRAPSSHTHAAGDITGTLALARIPGLPASQVTSGEFNSGRLPLASATNRGAISSAHFQLLEGATSNSLVNTIAMRDASGRLATQDPSVSTHAANKGYVDAQIGTRAPSSHNHSAANITSGTLALARIPGLPGAQITSGLIDLARIPSAVTVSGGNNLVQRNADGRANIGDPVTADNITNKRYVDSEVATRAPSSHNHPAANITSGTLALARLPSIPASQVSSGTFALARIPDLPASKIGSGTFDRGLLPSATDNLRGVVSRADIQSLVEGMASTTSTGGTLVQRASNGQFTVGAPTASTHVATKGYVDAEIGARALTFQGRRGASLNTLTTEGYHYIEGTNSNMPFDVNTAGVLLVLHGENEGDSLAQMFFNFSRNTVYFRTRHVGSWNGWNNLRS